MQYSNTDHPHLMAQEAQAAYIATPSPLRLIHRSRQGVSRTSFNKLAQDIKRSVLQLAEILPSSYSTLTKKDVFDKATSEHILLLKELFVYGVEVFGDIKKFNTWLDIAVRSFEDETPFSLLDTSFGIDLVRADLHKIDYGLPV